jgi:LPXTG-motif cell wall-anchored protein
MNMRNIVKICITLMMILVLTVPTFASTDFTPSVEKPGIDIDISDEDDNDSYGDGIDGENGQNGQNVPATGDDTNVLLWAGLGVAAAAGLVILMKRRHSEERNM